MGILAVVAAAPARRCALGAGAVLALALIAREAAETPAYASPLGAGVPALDSPEWDAAASEVDLSWSWDPLDGAPISYEVWRTDVDPVIGTDPRPVGCVPAVAPGEAEAARAFSDADVIRGKIYAYFVRAVLSDGQGGLTWTAFSDAVAVLVPLGTPEIDSAEWQDFDPEFAAWGGTRVRVRGPWPFPPGQEFGIVRVEGEWTTGFVNWRILDEPVPGASGPLFEWDDTAAGSARTYVYRARVEFRDPYDAENAWAGAYSQDVSLTTPESLVVGADPDRFRYGLSNVASSIKVRGFVQFVGGWPLSVPSTAQRLRITWGGQTFLDENVNPGKWKKSGSKRAYRHSTTDGVRRKFTYNESTRAFTLSARNLGTVAPLDDLLLVEAGKNAGFLLLPQPGD